MLNKQSILLLSACMVVYCMAATLTRNKREAWDLPDGIEEYIGSIKTNFECRTGGYFATEVAQYTFACGNQTIFNQFSMTCAHEAESIPCAQAPDFFYLNERIGQETAKLHEDADVEKAAGYLPARGQ